MTMLASQITSLTVVYSIVYSDVNQRKHQSSASLAFVREIHRRPVNFPHKWPVTRKMFQFDDVIMKSPLGPFTQQLRHFSPRQRNATRKPGCRPRWETWCRGVVPGDRAKQAVWEEHYERPQMNSSIGTGTRTPQPLPPLHPRDVARDVDREIPITASAHRWHAIRNHAWTQHHRSHIHCTPNTREVPLCGKDNVHGLCRSGKSIRSCTQTY